MTKRNILIGLVVLGLLGGGYWFWGGGAATFGPQPTPTPDFSAMSELDNLVTASGTLLPAKRANLAFKTTGQAISVTVKAGDKVKKGDLLIRLDAADAQAAVAVAQAQLDQTKAGPTKEEIAAAQAQLATAQAQLAKVRAGPTVEDIAISKATFDRAQSALKDAQCAYDKIKDDPQAGMYPQSQAYEAATQQYRVAEASYAKVVKGATPEDIRVAETNVAAAQANLNRVQAGARAEEVAAAQARLDQAKAALAMTNLTAPFDGTVAAVNVKEGEMVTPGVVVIALGDLNNLRLETDDLSETNIARVKMDQPVSVTFEALPGIKFAGKVTQIAVLSTPKQGGTNYTVTIEFDRLDPALRWGMTGHIEINTK
jgi:HlyD family secretion protein